MDGVEADAIRRFAEVVRANGKLSINMRLWVTANFLCRQPYENIYEFGARMSKLSSRIQDDIFKEKLGSYYRRRIAFDDLLVDGRGLQYAALNIGGMGPSRYGEFCVVFRPEARTGGRRVVYLKADSLNDYTSDAGDVHVARVREDLAAEESKHHLAALKHSDMIAHRADAEWCNMLCCDTAYIEALCAGRIELEDVAELRVAAGELARLWGLAFEDFSRRLAPGERAMANDFVQLLDAAGARGMPVQGV